jgi:hypothetical protein
MGEVSTKGMFLIALLLSASSEGHMITRQISNAGKPPGSFDEVSRKVGKQLENPPNLSPIGQPHLNWLVRQIA